MPALTKSTIFFSEETLNLDIWKLKKIANAARSRLPFSSGHIFVKLNEHVANCFLIIHGCTPNIPLDLWQATVVDEDEETHFKRLDVQGTKKKTGQRKENRTC